jgi:predicted phosphodiesterase
MRILTISDIHANVTAFDAVLEDANGEWDYVWCLGDVVGYGPDPNECIARLQELPHLCLAGNHDWAALGRLDIKAFSVDARHAAQWTTEQLTADSRAYLEDLPLTFTIGEFTLTHGSPREPVYEYILDPLTAQLNFSHFETPYCCFGHTHQPLMYILQTNGSVEIHETTPGQSYLLDGQRLLLNPGSVGQPRDQRPEAAYGILNLETHIFESRRVSYNILDVQTRMRAAHLPERLIVRLEHGW